MYCNYCSKFYESQHDNKKEKKQLYDIFYNLVREKYLINIIFDYKKSMEYETEVLSLKRFKVLSTYKQVKNIKVYNYFDKKLLIKFSIDKYKYNKRYFNYDKIEVKTIKYLYSIKLENNITFNSSLYKDVIRRCYLKTLDIPIHEIIKSRNFKSENVYKKLDYFINSLQEVSNEKFFNINM